MTSIAAPVHFSTGMRVTSTSPKYPGSGVVEKVNPRTIQVRLDSHLTVRFDRSFLIPEGGEAPAPAPWVLPTRALPTGTFCVYTGPSDSRLHGIWVVIGDQSGKTRIVRPNGTDGSRYWRIPNEQLTAVTCIVTPDTV